MALTLKVTPDRVSDMPFKVYRQVAKDPDCMARFIAHFAYDEAGDIYLDLETAMDLLDELNMREIAELVGAIKDQADEVAAPKA